MADFGFTPNLIASGDIYPFRFVEIATSAEFTGSQANAASDNILGATDGSIKLASPLISNQVHATTGDPITLQPTNTVQVEVGTGGVLVGSYITSDANGKAVIATTGQTAYYLSLQAGSAADIVRAFRIGPRVV